MKNKIVITLFGVIVLLLGAIVFQQYKISVLKAGPMLSVNQGTVNNFDLQQKCQQESGAFFPKAIDPNPVASTYVNHYDPQTNRCYIDVMESVKNSSVASGYDYYQTVWDVNEGSIYAMYTGNLGGWDSFILSGTLSCFVGTTTCKSGSEFDSLISQKFGLVGTN